MLPVKYKLFHKRCDPGFQCLLVLCNVFRRTITVATTTPPACLSVSLVNVMVKSSCHGKIICASSTTSRLKTHCDLLKIQAAACSFKYNYTNFQFTVIWHIFFVANLIIPNTHQHSAGCHQKINCIYSSRTYYVRNKIQQIQNVGRKFQCIILNTAICQKMRL